MGYKGIPSFEVIIFTVLMETLFIRLEEWLDKYFIIWPIDYDENINVFMRCRSIPPLA